MSSEKKIIRLNMTDLKITEQKVPEKYREMGGRWLTDSIVCDEVDPKCHPLGPNNKIVFAPGIVTGTPAPSSGRISVGAKSPLTGGIKEANAGTQFSQKMARLGIHALIVEGQPKEKGKFWLLKLDKDGAELHRARARRVDPSVIFGDVPPSPRRRTKYFLKKGSEWLYETF